ncbi:MAG: dihydroflavonol 4-reductase, partial [Clostridiaceae bacterium]
MEPVYVVTGAAGHLGNVVVRELLAKKRRVWQFLLEGEQSVVEGTERIFSGDVTICSSLIP